MDLKKIFTKELPTTQTKNYLVYTKSCLQNLSGPQNFMSSTCLLSTS
jgi:hypothetical protein